MLLFPFGFFLKKFPTTPAPGGGRREKLTQSSLRKQGDGTMKKKITSLFLALAMCLGLCAPALAAGALYPEMMEDKSQYPFPLGAGDTTWESYNIGNYNNEVSTTSHLYVNEKGGLTRVELTYTDLIVEEFNSAFQMVSHRYLTGAGTGFTGFYAGQDYNFVAHASMKPEGGGVGVSVDKYSKDWQKLQTGTLWDANTGGVFGAATDFTEKNGILFMHGAHTMSEGKGKGHQSDYAIAFRISDMTPLSDFTEIGHPIYVSHSLQGWHVLVDQEENLVTFQIGDGYPRAPVLHRVKGYGAAAVISPQSSERVTFFDIPGEIGNNTTGVIAGGLEETRNYYVCAYRANRELPGEPFSRGPFDNYLAFVSKKDLSVNIVRLDEPVSAPNNTFPMLVSAGLDGGYVLWTNYNGDTDRIGEGNVLLATYSDGAVGPTRNLGRGTRSDCRPILYNGRLVWYCTRYSAPVFYGADTTGMCQLSPAATAPGALGGPTATMPAQPAVPSGSTGATGSSGFADVAANSPYKDAIAWAVERGITNGTSAATFSPNEKCTIRQVVTFLCRASGQTGASMDEAEAWAVTQGIMDDRSQIDPSIPCSRVFAVTCLWRAAGSPMPSKTVTFSDVHPNEYLDTGMPVAISWAVEKGITNGTGADTFSPNDTCTRGQIVTFLYRARS